MSGVSIDTRSPSQTDIDMALAYEGGGNFMSRLTQLSDLKQRHDEALAELNLGQTAKAALADAQSKQTEAAAQLDEANRTLRQAEQSAAETIKKAREQAAGIIVDAQTAAAASLNEASATKSNAEAYSVKVKADGDAWFKQAAQAHSDTLAALAAHQAAQASAKAAQDSAEQAKADADTARQRFERKVADLHAAINKVKAS